MGIQINGNTNNINAGIGSLSIEDINELDIVGVATAANFKTGVSNLHSVGLSLSGGQIDVGSNIKIGNAGVITATSFVGSGANLTSLPAQVTLNNNADNRVITGGSGVNLYAESGFTYDGTTVQIPDRINCNTNGTYLKENQLSFNPTGTAYLDHYRTGQDIQIRMSTSSSLDTTGPTFKSNGNLAFASGKGIDFSATGNAGGMSSELLDDYEEGSWTPSTSEGAAHTVFGSSYTKIGRQVTATCYINITASSSSSTIRIDGLPFTSIGSSHYAIGSCYTQFTADKHVFFQVSNSATHGYIYTGLGSGVAYNTPNASGGYFLMTVTYFAV